MVKGVNLFVKGKNCEVKRLIFHLGWGGSSPVGEFFKTKSLKTRLNLTHKNIKIKERGDEMKGSNQIGWKT